MKSKKLLTVLLMTAALLMLSALSAFANSAQQSFVGTAANGAIITDKESPITVERERLVFDIPEFPEHYYSNAEQLSEYDAKVSAEYSFYNPADYSVKATLLFPFGTLPMYVDGVNYDSGEPVSVIDLSDYGVKINGEQTEITLRHTYSEKYTPFDYEQQLEYLSGRDAEKGILKREARVMRYEFEAENFPEGEDYLTFTVSIEADDGFQIIANPRYFMRDKTLITLGFSVRAGESFVLYTVGERQFELEDIDNWNGYLKGAIEERNRTSAKPKLKYATELTFGELAMSEYSESLGVSEQDWYNAFVAMLGEHGNSYSFVSASEARFDLTEDLMRWYEYEIELAPGERITNIVCAPIYPDYDTGYSPYIYRYTYLTSPARSFTEFGELEIIINTPYSIVESMTEILSENQKAVLQETDGGYRIVLSGLPDREIVFTLSESPSPVRENNGGGGMLIEMKIFIGVCAGIVVLTAAAVTTVVILRRKAKRSSPPQKTDESAENEE